MSKEQERDRQVSPEIFVIRQEQEKLLEYVTKFCRPLYGSGILVDPGGNIFYETWHQVEREGVEPETYSLLSQTREGEESYLARPLTSKKLCELRINQIKKDDGSVEVAIRSVEHVLKTQIEKEFPQVEVTRQRISELFDLFFDFSNVPDAQFKKAENETCRRLVSVGLDPERVVLEEKRRMANWIIKASGGKDSLERRNPLIMTMALEAANRRAIEQELGIGKTVSKFIRMREALRFERAFSL